MKHTKGKWVVHQKGQVQRIGDNIYITVGTEQKASLKDPLEFPVANVLVSERIIKHGISRDIPTAYANAKLISKAPEMYEALKKIYCYIPSTPNTLKPDGMRSVVKSLLKEIES